MNIILIYIHQIYVTKVPSVSYKSYQEGYYYLIFNFDDDKIYMIEPLLFW